MMCGRTSRLLALAPLTAPVSPQPDAPLRTRVATSVAQVEQLVPRWEALRQELNGSPLLGTALYLGWLEELGGRCAPFAVALEDKSGTLRAVAPWARRGPIVFSVPGRTMVTGELLVDDGDAHDAWTHALAAALGSRSRWAVMVPHATPDPRGLTGARAASADLRLRCHAWPRFERNRLRPGDMTFDQYMQRWSSTRRRHLRRSRMQLERLGRVRFRAVPPIEGYELLRSMHNRRWQPGQSVYWMHSEAGARIDRRMLAELPGQTLLLELDEVPIAAATWLDCGDFRVAVYIARDPDVRVGSPGELLFVETLRRAFLDGIRELDLMGAGGYKASFGVRSEVGYEILVTRRGPVGHAIPTARAMQFRLRDSLTRRRIRVASRP